MNDYYSAESGKSPLLKGSMETGEVEIGGVCLLEDAKVFFRPFVEWLNDFAPATPSSKITMRFTMHYFNTTSAKIILDLIKMLYRLAEREQKSFEAVWYYDVDDEDMKETGLDYQAMVGDLLKIRMID